jgi:hypothetical protein
VNFFISQANNIKQIAWEQTRESDTAWSQLLHRKKNMPRGYFIREAFSFCDLASNRELLGLSTWQENHLTKRKYRGQSISGWASDSRLFAANTPLHIDLVVCGICHLLKICPIWQARVDI